MDVIGTVTGTGNAERVHLSVKADRAGRIIGKRGSTLGAIRHLLDLALAPKHGSLTIDVDVDDDRPADQREPRPERRERSDRPPGERSDRGPERTSDRGDRGGERSDRGGDRGGRGGDRGDRGGRRPERGGDREEAGRYPAEKLRALARRAAEKAKESGQTITINLELNSYDRRLVHMEVAELGLGVVSRSEEKTVDGKTMKYVQVIPEASAS